MRQIPHSFKILVLMIPVLMGLESHAWPRAPRKSSAPHFGPPTFVAKYEVSSWTTVTSPKTISSFNVIAGDILVAYGVEPTGLNTISISGGSLTWNLVQSNTPAGAFTTNYLWAATVDVDKSMTVMFTRGAASNNFGGGVVIFRNSSGIGSSSKTNATGAPSVNLTPTKANSAIVVLVGDWNAVDGTSRTWRTNANALTETSYVLSPTEYTVYAGYHPDAGVLGTYAIGLSAPGGQTYAIMAVEVKGPN